MRRIGPPPGGCPASRILTTRPAVASAETGDRRWTISSARYAPSCGWRCRISAPRSDGPRGCCCLPSSARNWHWSMSRSHQSTGMRASLTRSSAATGMRSTANWFSSASSWRFAVLAAASQYYFGQTLQIRWRRWLTANYVSRWMADGRHYRVRVVAPNVDNIHLRIANDVYLFIQRTHRTDHRPARQHRGAGVLRLYPVGLVGCRRRCRDWRRHHSRLADLGGLALCRRSARCSRIGSAGG